MSGGAGGAAAGVVRDGDGDGDDAELTDLVAFLVREENGRNEMAVNNKERMMGDQGIRGDWGRRTDA